MEGDIDGSEIKEIDRKMREQIARTDPAAGISDLTGVRNFNVPSEIMRAAALRPAPYPPETRRVIVAPSDLLFGMSRMYELVADRPAGILQVVRCMEEALAAIGVLTPKFEPLD